MKKLILAVMVLLGLGLYAGVSLMGTTTTPAVAADKP